MLLTALYPTRALPQGHSKVTHLEATRSQAGYIVFLCPDLLRQLGGAFSMSLVPGPNGTPMTVIPFEAATP